MAANLRTIPQKAVVFATLLKKIYDEAFEKIIQIEWTNNLKDAFKHNITRAKIVYDNTEINYDNGIKEITLEDSVYVPDVDDALLLHVF